MITLEDYNETIIPFLFVVNQIAGKKKSLKFTTKNPGPPIPKSLKGNVNRVVHPKPQKLLRQTQGRAKKKQIVSTK